MSLIPFVHLDVDLSDAQVGDGVPLDPEAIHHLTRVLRLRDGAHLEVADGQGASVAATLATDHVVVQADVDVRHRRAPLLTVAQALPKARKLDEVVRQVTELGADAIVPVLAERSVARPTGDRAERLRVRARGVARAAAEQARSPWRPDVAPPVPTAELADALPGPDAEVLVAHLGAPPLPDVLRGLAPEVDVVIAIGPEGGWSDAEVARLVTGGGRVVGLGETVLRTEHAAAAALAVIAAALGRWG